MRTVESACRLMVSTLGYAIISQRNLTNILPGYNLIMNMMHACTIGLILLAVLYTCYTILYAHAALEKLTAMHEDCW